MSLREMSALAQTERVTRRKRLILAFRRAIVELAVSGGSENVKWQRCQAMYRLQHEYAS